MVADPTFEGVFATRINDLLRIKGKVRVNKDRRFEEEKLGSLDPEKIEGLKENSEMFQRTFRLVGVTFNNAQKNIRTFGNGDIGSYGLVREPDNPLDPNAIKVMLAGVVFLGYVPREIAEELAPLMDQGREFTAFFVRLNRHPYKSTVGLTVRIEEYPYEAAA